MDYKELERMVINHQNSNHNINSSSIIRYYNNHLLSYVRLLKHGQWDQSNTRKFMSMLYKEELNRCKDRLIVLDELAKKLMNCFNHMDEQEIYNECAATLLEIVQYYVSTDSHPMFYLYVDKSFNKYLINNIRDIINDAYNKLEIVEYDEDSFMIDSIDIMDNEIINEKADNYNKLSLAKIPTIQDDSPYNLNWINGITAQGVFKSLNTIDRRILSMYYGENKTDTEIARTLGYGTREAINRCRNRIIKRVRTYAKDYHLLCM